MCKQKVKQFCQSHLHAAASLKVNKEKQHISQVQFNVTSNLKMHQFCFRQLLAKHRAA